MGVGIVVSGDITWGLLETDTKITAVTMVTDRQSWDMLQFVKLR